MGNMVTIRRPYDRNFTVIPNEYLLDDNLDVYSRWLLTVILSIDDRTWDFSISGLAIYAHAQPSTIQSHLKNLEDFGYMTRTRVADDTGRYTKWFYTFYDTPITTKTVEEPKEKVY